MKTLNRERENEPSSVRCKMYRIAGITWNIASIQVKCRTALKSEFELVICLRRCHFSFLISYLCWAHVERFFGSTARSIFTWAICKSRTALVHRFFSAGIHLLAALSAHTHWNHLVRAFSPLVMGNFELFYHCIALFTRTHNLWPGICIHTVWIAWECDECEMNVSMTRSLYSKCGFYLREMRAMFVCGGDCNIAMRQHSVALYSVLASMAPTLISWHKNK